jgi:osmoprotectant transport system permease protein
MDIINQTVAWLTDPAHWTGPNGIPVRMTEHVVISAISLAIAIAIAIPIGLYIGHTGKHTTFAVNSANLWRALPSLAVIAIVLPITARLDPELGFKVYPTIIAMVVLAVPPIMVNTYSGLAGVDRDILEAGRGQGMAEAQILRKVELPLSVAVITVGVRSAAIQVVATATLGAVFGFGGLGRYLVDGMAQISQGGVGMIFSGVILVAGLVIVTELGFALVQRRLTPRGLRASKNFEIE